MTCDFRTQSWNPGHPSALVLPSPLIYNQTSKSQEPVLLINYLLPELRVGLPGQIKSQGVVWGGEKDMRSRGKPAPLSGAAPHNSCEEFHTHPGVYILGGHMPHFAYTFSCIQVTTTSGCLWLLKSPRRATHLWRCSTHPPEHTGPVL